MKRSNRLVILVGVLLAVVAFVGIVILLNQAATTAPSERQTSTVLVAKEPIAVGDSITPDKVETKEVPPNGVQGTALVDVSQVGSRPALVAVPQGGQVSQETVGFGQGVGCISCQLEAGEKAIAFQVDRTTGLNFLVQQGDHIDVVVSEQIPALMAPPGDSLRTVKTVLQNKRVLYVSLTNVKSAQATPTPSEGESQPAPAGQQPIITSVFIVFAGNDQDAEIIKFAQLNEQEMTGGSGSLTAVIRSSGDNVTEKTTGMTIDRLIADHGLIVPDVSNIDTGAIPAPAP